MEGDNLLNINLEFHKGILFVRLDGNLDINTIDKLDKEVTSLIKENGIKNIVFNFSNLNSIDCHGINKLLDSYKICKSNNGKSLVCGISNGLVKQRVNNSRLLKYMYETSDELTAFSMINL